LPYPTTSDASVESLGRQASRGQQDFLKVENDEVSDGSATVPTFKIGDDDYRLKTEFKLGLDSKFERDLKLEGDFKSDIKLEARNFGDATNRPADVDRAMGHATESGTGEQSGGEDLFRVKLEQVAAFPDEDDGPGPLVQLQPDDSVGHLLDPADIDHDGADKFEGHGDAHEGVEHSDATRHVDDIHDIEL
jgi:hypothetical protein